MEEVVRKAATDLVVEKLTEEAKKLVVELGGFRQEVSDDIRKDLANGLLNFKDLFG